MFSSFPAGKVHMDLSALLLLCLPVSLLLLSPQNLLTLVSYSSNFYTLLPPEKRVCSHPDGPALTLPRRLHLCSVSVASILFCGCSFSPLCLPHHRQASPPPVEAFVLEEPSEPLTRLRFFDQIFDFMS